MGGFPCQPFSVAGKQKGTSDDRHLWPEMFRIIKAFKPRFVIGENVRGIVNIQDGVVFETVCTDLESEGYEVQPFNIPAASVGAPHRRERIWIIATLADSVSNDERREISRSYEEEKRIQEEHRQNNSPTGKSSRTSEIRNGDNGYENMENSRRTLQQGTELREKNEDEVGKENANQHQRSSSTSESNVANAKSSGTRENDEGLRSRTSRISRGQRTSGTEEDVANANARLSNGSFEEVQSGRNTSDTSSEGTTDVANTESSIGHDFYSIARNGEPSLQEIFGDGSSLPRESSWWDVEPNVGRVAHGIPGRVHRLKGLGNSIIPQIAEEIGKAIIKAKEVNEV
jgi:DNA (cytosine-5)-methyltransferase 1